MKNNNETSKYKYALILILAAIGLSACSSTKVPENARLAFQTRITSSGLKHFQLGMLTPAIPQAIITRPNRQRNSRPGGERSTRAVEGILQQALADKIKTSLFCRDGYWILDKNLYGNKVYLRGECNETATQEDRENFPDTLLHW